MSAICSRCSPSSSITTTVIDLIARWICKRQYRADQRRMASLLVERFSADFITRTAGLHDRCTFAALHLVRIGPSGQDWYANLLWVDARKWLLLAHAGSLLSAFAPAIGTT